MSSALQVKSCKALVAHTEEDLVEAMQRDKKELRDKIESESGDVKRKMELECNEMRDRLQSEKKAASVAMEEEVEERKRDINQIRQTVSKEWGQGGPQELTFTCKYKYSLKRFLVRVCFGRRNEWSAVF